jgi:hypothetical protein
LIGLGVRPEHVKSPDVRKASQISQITQIKE